jgi:transcriptional regulator with XRE-family HTH domain
MTDSIINIERKVEYMNTIGENIKRIRKNLKITQEDLAKAINLTADYISKLETGKRENPSMDVLEKLASVLNCSKFDLIGENSIEDYNELSIAKALKETYLNSNKRNENKSTSQSLTDTLVKRLIKEGIIDTEGNISPSDLKLLEEVIKLDAKLNNNLKKSSK